MMQTKAPTLYSIPYNNQPGRIPQNISAPLVICRCCGEHIEPKWQPGSGRRAGCWLLTCTNEACALCNYTFSTARYNDLDLTPYLESAYRRH
jgi:hypothetical protein